MYDVKSVFFFLISIESHSFQVKTDRAAKVLVPHILQFESIYKALFDFIS